MHVTNHTVSAVKITIVGRTVHDQVGGGVTDSEKYESPSLSASAPFSLKVQGSVTSQQSSTLTNSLVEGSHTICPHQWFCYHKGTHPGRALMGHLACSYIHTDLYIPLLLLHDNSLVWVYVRRSWVFLGGEGNTR